VLTAAAPLQAVRAARTPTDMTELGDGGRQGEQSLTPAGAPGASALCILRGLANPHFLLEIEAIAAG
jgi:hypothetical protein